MAKTAEINKDELMKKLPRVAYNKADDAKGSFLGKMSLDRALLALLEIHHEQEYELCRSLAAHVCGNVREPDDSDLEDI